MCIARHSKRRVALSWPRLIENTRNTLSLFSRHFTLGGMHILQWCPSKVLSIVQCAEIYWRWAGGSHAYDAPHGCTMFHMLQLNSIGHCDISICIYLQDLFQPVSTTTTSLPSFCLVGQPACFGCKISTGLQLFCHLLQGTGKSNTTH